jgi:hypothetical protein
MNLSLFGTSTLFSIIPILFGALILWGVTRIFKLKKQFLIPLSINAIAHITGIILGFIFNLIFPPPTKLFYAAFILLFLIKGAIITWLITYFYKEKLKKAILIWFIYFAISTITTIIILGFMLRGLTM